ncbi:MAG: hypothetical protein HYU28_05240 [Actinobacteria bacterium]|nr:hypothetical protein [Actinomycetota bacterium]
MNTTAPPTDAKADLIAARATGAGIGALAFMVTWLVGNRITVPLLGDAPGAWLALGLALGAGIIVTLVAGARLTRRVEA